MILYDGVCHVCSGSVRFVARRDRHARFQFAPLQSDAAARMLRMCGGETVPLSTLILVLEGRCYDRSEAILRIAARLGFPWNLAAVARLVPRVWRDALYSRFAARRYRWFGRKETCDVAPPEWKDRFLD